MTQAQWEAIYWEQREEWNALDPRFKVRDVVFWFHKPLGVGKYMEQSDSGEGNLTYGAPVPRRVD